ncbi:hypothetical protein G6514_009949 [Epicoccum nigrum]|nr:hypothetical protein G6514_009949 [Epicoccum nigrum]
MYLSVASYWKALKSIGSEFKAYKPCDGILGFGRAYHHSSCSYEKCLDFGLQTKAEATLKKHGHYEVSRHLLSDEFLKA